MRDTRTPNARGGSEESREFRANDSLFLTPRWLRCDAYHAKKFGGKSPNRVRRFLPDSPVVPLPRGVAVPASLATPRVPNSARDYWIFGTAKENADYSKPSNDSEKDLTRTFESRKSVILFGWICKARSTEGGRGDEERRREGGRIDFVKSAAWVRRARPTPHAGLFTKAS